MGKIPTDHTLEGVQFNSDNVFFLFLVDEVIEDPVTTKRAAFIYPPAKRHLNGILLAG